MTVIIQADGSVKCLYTDKLPLAEIGALKVKRASTIEFNDSTQLWEVRLGSNASPDFTSASRQACIDWEIKTIEATL